MDFNIRQVYSLPDLSGLLEESGQQGFRFLERLQADYESGANRFARPGEALFAVFAGDRCVGIGGINVDPAGAARVGRVRRFYIASAYRRHGLGRQLMEQIEQAAEDSFDTLCLFTDTEAAARFYETQGYVPVNEDHVSHRKILA